MSRTITQQLNYCIYQCDKRGTSKRGDRMNGVKTNNRIYSNQRIGDLKKLSKSIGSWMRETHPEIREVRDIRSEHLQEFIEARSSSWSARTEAEQVSRIHKLQDITNHTYHLDNKWSVHTTERDHAGKVRDRAMDRGDFETLRETLSNKRTEGKYALEITARTGLRVAEVAGLKVKGIDTHRWVIEVREGAKNGNHRDVPIREADRAYFAELRANLEARGREYVTNGVQPESLDKSIRRAMKETGLTDKYPKTTDHAIRKMYASERMVEERAEGKSEREAWETVQQELGHGPHAREELYAVYVGGTLV